MQTDTLNELQHVLKYRGGDIIDTKIRNVTLYCPTCGNDLFSYTDVGTDDLLEAPDEVKIQCTDCKCIYTKEELIEANQDIINANIEEVQQNLIKDIEKSLKKLFK